MIRQIGIALAVAGVFTLASCTTQQTMRPSYVDALHSGKLVVEQTASKIKVLTPVQLQRMFHAGFGSSMAMGMLFGVPAEIGEEASVNAGNAQERKMALKALQPYLNQLHFASLSEALVNSAKKAAAGVPWLKNSANPVGLFQSSKPMGERQMKEITQSSEVNAVAFIIPLVAFSPNLKTLYVFAPVNVYAHSSKKAVFLDGGGIIAASHLASTSPALDSNGVEGIASSKSNKAEAVNARAKVWFANNGARVKQAFTNANELFACKLRNYLTAKRGTPNPGKC